LLNIRSRHEGRGQAVVVISLLNFQLNAYFLSVKTNLCSMSTILRSFVCKHGAMQKISHENETTKS